MSSQKCLVETDSTSLIYFELSTTAYCFKCPTVTHVSHMLKRMWALHLLTLSPEMAQTFCLSEEKATTGLCGPSQQGLVFLLISGIRKKRSLRSLQLLSWLEDAL